MAHFSKDFQNIFLWKKILNRAIFKLPLFSKKKIMLLYLFFCIVVFNCLDDFTVYWVPILKYFAVRLGFPSPSNGLKQRENPEIVLRVIQRYPEYEIQDEIRKLNPPHTNLHTTPLILRIEIRWKLYYDLAHILENMIQILWDDTIYTFFGYPGDKNPKCNPKISSTFTIGWSD